jgi:hypothetical protein
MLTVTSAAAGVTLIGLGAAGTTLALWQDSELLNAPAIVSGSLDLTVEGTDSYALPGSWTDLLPGDRRQVAVDVQTSGSAASDVTVAVSNAGGFDIRALRGACPGSPLPETPASLGTWTATDSHLVCLEVSPGASVTEASSQNFTLTFTATQLAS